MRPALLVRSGKGTPKWTSPLECQKLAVGTSIFECCANNHSKIKECRRSICLKSLDEMIERRARSLFSSNKCAEARFTICFRNYWCRGLIDETTRVSWNTLKEFQDDLRWIYPPENNFIDREGFPLLGYAVGTDCERVVEEVLTEIKHSSEPQKWLRARAPKSGLVVVGITGHMTVLGVAMIGSSPNIVSLL